MGISSLGGLSIAAGFAVLATFGATACGTGSPSCPDIGWFNELIIEVDENMRGVDSVHVCAGSECIPNSRHDLDSPDITNVALQIRDVARGQWIFTTGMDTPGEVTVRVDDAFGGVLTEKIVEPAWARVGGTPQCGGPEMATVVMSW